MSKKKNPGLIDRRDFIKLLAAGAAAETALLAAHPQAEAGKKPAQPAMTYRELGRTKFKSSRLVFGCGAALAGGRAVRLLDRAFAAGINHYDVGSDIFYRGSERSLAPFLKAHRGKVWVASKAPLLIRIKPDDPVTVEQARAAAKSWTKLLNASLKDLGADGVDAYYLMALDNPFLISSEEIYKAFLEAKAAGKVRFFGLSTHKNAKNVLEAAIKTKWYDLAMIGVTPAGWYDWDTKSLAKDTPTLLELQPLLKRARDAGIGLIGMKTVRYLAPMMALGRGDPTAFDKFYDEKFKRSPLNAFQRAYAYVLEHGLDVVNADMQNFKHLEENIHAAAVSANYFA